MKKVVLRNSFSPGDIVLLTAAVRDLHVCYPNRLLIDVRTPCPQLWENNPYLTPLDERDPEVEVIDCQYPLITEIEIYRYAEIHGAHGVRQEFDPEGAPAEGTTHEYKCEIDKASGTWSYFFDGSYWMSFQDNGWINRTGTHVQWQGEILNKEDDMPGTVSNKCKFTNCAYRTDGNQYQAVGLIAADVKSSDANEWGAQWLSETSFDIWDKNPLP